MLDSESIELWEATLEACFGVPSWQSMGCWDTRFGRKRLYEGPYRTPRFDDAMRHCGDLLRAVGFDGSDRQRPKVWIGEDYDDELAALVLAEVEAHLEVVYRRQRERPAHAQRELRDLVEERPWLLQPAMLAEAEVYLAREPFYYSMTVEKILAASKATEARIRDRMCAPIEPVAGDLVGPIHEALRIVSSSDLDGAKYKNGWGWGKATSIPGHWLSKRSRLTPEQAAHGLRLLKVHRKQLPRQIRKQIGL